MDEELTKAIQRCVAVLKAASLETAGSTWAFDTFPPKLQRSAPAAIVDSTHEVFLKLNLANGQPIKVQSPSPPLIMPAGIFRDAVEPVVRMLKAEVDQIVNSGEIWELGVEIVHFQHFGKRVDYYLAQLAAAPHGPEPSEKVWANVSMPLFSGLYPEGQGFEDMGIVNPAVRAPPDVVYISTINWMLSIVKQHRAERFTKLWADVEAQILAIIEGVFQLVTEAIVAAAELAGKAIGSAAKGAGAGLGVSPWLVGAAAVTAGGVYYVTNKRSK